MKYACQEQAAQFTAEALARRYMALYDGLLASAPKERALALAEATR